MAKTSIENLLDNHLEGLILPIEKSSANIFFVGILILLLAVLALFFIWYGNKTFNNPQRIAKRKLKKLHTEYQSHSDKTPQEIAQQLIHILKEGLKIADLEMIESKALLADTDKWKYFAKDIEQASFSKMTKVSDLDNLFEQASFWLNKVTTQK